MLIIEPEKRTTHQHFPKERYNKSTNKEKWNEWFYKDVSKYPIDKIICLDKTSIGSYLKHYIVDIVLVSVV